MKLTMEKLVYGGQGLARIPEEAGERGGMRVFVPFTLPGEVVEADIVAEHRGYCVGDVRVIERASVSRVEPLCPWFGVCGGCQLQHSSYAHQVELKCAMLRESLTRAGIRNLPEIASLAGAPFGYRNRIRLLVASHPQFSIGYRRAKSHRMAAIDRCPIATPILERCIDAIRSLGLRKLVPAEAREMELFTNHDQSELLLTIWITPHTRFEQKPYAEFFKSLQEKIPQLAGAAVRWAEEEPASTVRPLLQWGRQSLLYRVAARDYIVSQGSFFQVNSCLLDDFVAAVVGAESGACAWDLFAGVGLFSRALAERFERIVAVESNPSSIGDFRKNLEGKSATAVCTSALEFLQQAMRRIEQHREAAPDLVVLDPPRAGLGVAPCRLLVQCAPRRIVYVSCDPATLGRDLAALIQSGYSLHQLRLVDMFPQTGHLETIAMLMR